MESIFDHGVTASECEECKFLPSLKQKNEYLKTATANQRYMDIALLYLHRNDHKKFALYSGKVKDVELLLYAKDIIEQQLIVLKSTKLTQTKNPAM